jgi:hypothetical protein
MVMPPAPPAHLILPHAQVLLAILNTGLDGPAPAALPHQGGQRRGGGGIAQLRLQLPRHHALAQHQPDCGAGQALPPGSHPDPGKASPQGPLAPCLERPSPPALRRQPGRQLRDRDGLRLPGQAADACRGAPLARPAGEPRGRALWPAPGVRRDLGTVPQTHRRQPIQPVGIAPNGFITGAPATAPGARLPHRGDHLPAQQRLRRASDRPWHPAARAPRRRGRRWPPTPAARRGGDPAGWSLGGWHRPSSPRLDHAPASPAPRNTGG